MDTLYELARRFVGHAQGVFLSASDPSQRVYVVYLLTSIMIAGLIYRSRQGRQISEEKSFLGFLFPKKVWSHPSAWLDLRFFSMAFLASSL